MGALDDADLGVATAVVTTAAPEALTDPACPVSTSVASPPTAPVKTAAKLEDTEASAVPAAAAPSEGAFESLGPATATF